MFRQVRQELSIPLASGMLVDSLVDWIPCRVLQLFKQVRPRELSHLTTLVVVRTIPVFLPSCMGARGGLR